MVTVRKRSRCGNCRLTGDTVRFGLVRPPSIILATLTILLASACKPTTGADGSGSTASTQQQAGRAAGSHLVVLSDPGHVTYSIHPTSCHATGSGPTSVRPDPTCTPGGIDPAVTQANLKTTICKTGYTSTVRPPESETGKAKKLQYTNYGIPAGTTSELDHLVSLELGGDNDIANLWPEVGKLPNPKDSVENRLHRAVCAGTVKLADAQEAIAKDWTTAETKLGIK